MAEIGQNTQQSAGKVRSKKHSTAIDMTPMVDLAFLLLTFFILTTTFSKPPVLELSMPEKSADPNIAPRVHTTNVLNLVLAENNKIFWWIGESSPEITNYSSQGVRQILLSTRSENPQVIVFIKPRDNSTYENLVDILDEMQITMMPRYAIVDFTIDDQRWIADH